MSGNTHGSRAAAAVTVAVLVVVTLVGGAAVVSVSASAVAASTTDDSTGGVSAGEVSITESGFADSDVVERRGDTLYLWADESAQFTLVLQTGQSDGEGHYEACLQSTVDAGENRSIACRSLVLSGGSTTEVTFDVDSWGDGGPGPRTVEAVVTADTLDAEVAAAASHDVVVLRKTADPDRDGATNRQEVRAGTDFSVNDTDGDDLLDGLELDTYDTNPLVADTDGDGLDDGREILQTHTDPTATDTDRDDLSDRREVETTGTNPLRLDTDGDGLQDGREVRVHGTDPTDIDTDGDGLVDGREVTVHDTNPTAADTDDDGLSDAHERHGVQTNPTAADTDGDGISDGREVNVVHSDPLAVDTDGDGLSDGRELDETGTNPLVVDTDGDGLSDGREVNAFGTDPLVSDTDGDGVADAREVDAGPLPRWAQVYRTPLAAFGFLLVGGFGAFLTRGRWLPRVPERVRTAVRDDPAVQNVRAVFPADRVGAVHSAVEDVVRRLRSAAVAARVAAVDPNASTERSPEADGGPAVGSETASAQTEQSDSRTVGDVSTDDPTRDQTGDSREDQAQATPDPVLTPEQQVQSLLSANGGRLKQSDLVELTGWSKSKVSRTLSRMADDGSIEKTTIGRGNVISLPEHTPEGARSPFDEE
ncbi:helix-turn-helix transcriptional regulator [Halobaculum limi]|uniref:helix-turn-helix transcriptional regulator n=1 Tax=Halobaculum limi TaxID=3031916 RepID=UPI002404ED15|nr:hypothetical protein [Halobaculum sp. YSMS11]